MVQVYISDFVIYQGSGPFFPLQTKSTNTLKRLQNPYHLHPNLQVFPHAETPVAWIALNRLEQQSGIWMPKKARWIWALDGGNFQNTRTTRHGYAWRLLLWDSFWFSKCMGGSQGMHILWEETLQKASLHFGNMNRYMMLINLHIYFLINPCSHVFKEDFFCLQRIQDPKKGIKSEHLTFPLLWDGLSGCPMKFDIHIWIY